MAHTSCLIHWQRCRNRLKSLIRRSIHCRGTLPTVIVAAALMVTVDITIRGTKGE